jgi:hypothetical protein
LLWDVAVRSIRKIMLSVFLITLKISRFSHGI